MTATREVKITIDDSFTAGACNFAVGFLKFEDGGQTAVPAGTGTFARLGNTSGIITAGHVIENLPKDKVGLVRFLNIGPDLQNHKLDMEHADQKMMWSGKEGEAPDLGFLKIPSQDAKDLEADGSVFYNLGREREFAPGAPAHSMSQAYAVVGVVAEWTEESSGTLPRTKKTTVAGLFGAAKITREFTENDTGLVEVEIDYASGPKIPASYGGVSGGALWELHVELDAEEKVVSVNERLHGIAFRQSDDHRLIVSNGASSIASLVQAIAAKWPDG